MEDGPEEQVEEQVEVIRPDGTVERVVPRSQMRAERLRHRSVGIAVRRPGDGAVLAHQRAGWKDLWPSYWDLAFGGVCAAGESYEQAAVRELAEEAGIEVGEHELRALGEGSFEDGSVALVAGLFEVRHGGPFTFADGEVARVEWVPLAELDRWLEGRQVVPDTLALGVPWLRTLLP